jgi:hypothetical protein
MRLIIDERMRQVEKDALNELGYELIEIKQSKNVYSEISSHVDIFTCKVGEKIIVEPSQYKSIKSQIPSKYNLEQGQEYISIKYPDDIKYNVCTIGKKAIHNFQYTDPIVKQELVSQEYELINTTQGYTNCSIAVIDANSAIVTDKGLYKILQKHNIDVLYLQYEPEIKLLNDNGYSNKKGFIGGVISRIANQILVTGDLDKIDQSGLIRKFVLSKGLGILEFKGLDVIDYGGIVEL